MENIIRKNGYVYLVKGEKGFETFYNMGKDENDPMWKEEVKEMNIGDDEIETKSKRKNTKNEEEI